VTIPTAVRAVVSNYSRRNSWLEARELQQVAALTMIEASRTWKPGGAPLAAYQARAVALSLKRHIEDAHCPVPNRHRSPEGVRRCDLVDLPDRGEAPQAEWHIDLKRAAEEVRRILSRQSPAAVAVLLGEREPALVAAELGLPASRVYVEAQAARRALRGSAKLAQLARAVL